MRELCSKDEVRDVTCSINKAIILIGGWERDHTLRVNTLSQFQLSEVESHTRPHLSLVSPARRYLIKDDRHSTGMERRKGYAIKGRVK